MIYKREKTQKRDLILERGKNERIILEIKSKNTISERDLQHLKAFKDDLKAQTICLSQDPIIKQIADIMCLDWKGGIAEIFA